MSHASQHSAFARFLPVSASAITVLAGLLALLGWKYDITFLISVQPGMEPIKPESALGCVLLGLALLCETQVQKHAVYRRARILLAGVGAFLGSFTLWEALFAPGPAIHLLVLQFLKAPQPGEKGMAVGSTVALLLVSSALLVLDWGTRRGWRPAQFLCLAALFPSLLGILDNLLTPFYSYTGMALPTSLTLGLLALGTIAVRAEKGFMPLLWSDTPGGVARRRLLPAALLIPILLGWLRWQGQMVGLYSSEFGTAIFTVATVTVLAALIWWSANFLDKVDLRRREAEEELRRSHANLEQIVVDRTRDLLASKEEYHALFESANEAILIFEPEEETILVANPAACEMYGVSHHELIGGTLRTYTSNAAAGQVQLRGLSGAGTCKNLETVHVRKDGTLLYLLVNSSVIDYRGRKAVLTVMRDVSDRVRAEEERKLLSAAIEQAAESVLITDPAGAIVYANAAFEQVSGYSRAEVLGQNPRILKSGRQDAEFYRRLWSTLAAGEAWTGHFVNKRKDGSLYEEEATISPVRDSEDRTLNYVAVKRDVTREKQLELQLYQSQKLEAIGQLAGGVAHDFNNLLNVILGYSELLLEKLPPAASQRKHLEEIRKAGQSAAALTSQLLAFSRKQVLQRQVLNLNSVIAHAEKILRRLIGEDIELVTTLDPALDDVLADSGQLEQVIFNLAVNSRDAMPQGGRLTLETTNVNLDEDYARRHLAMKPGSYVMLAMTDTGVGMDQETQAHIFEPFFTTKEMGKGTGLGLATVYGIVKQSEGFIWVYSEVGHGTTFKIYLPRVEKGAKIEKGGAQPGEATGGVETILVVEDQQSLRELICEGLQAKGYTVLAAKDAAQALQMCAQAGQSIRLMLTDLVMPGMDGRALAERVGAVHPAIKIIYMSGYTDRGVIHNNLLREGVAFLQKPFRLADLLQNVRELLDKRGARG